MQAQRTLFPSSASLLASSVAVASSLLKRSRSSVFLLSWVCLLSFIFLPLPLITPSETPPSERPQLFIKKLHQCRVLFDFNDASAELKGKQIKAQTLHEMLEYITTQRGIITENIYPEVVGMVSSTTLVLSPRPSLLICFSVCYQSFPFDTPSSQPDRRCI